MPVKIVEKQKPAKASKAKQASAVAQTVEQMAEMKIQIDQFKKVEQEYNKLRDTLKGLIPPDAPAEQPVVFMGTEHAVEFAAAAEVRKVSDIRQLHQQLGDLFYEIVAVQMKELDRYVDEEAQSQIITRERTGSRVCKVKEI